MGRFKGHKYVVKNTCLSLRSNQEQTSPSTPPTRRKRSSSDRYVAKADASPKDGASKACLNFGQTPSPERMNPDYWSGPPGMEWFGPPNYEMLMDAPPMLGFDGEGFDPSCMALPPACPCAVDLQYSEVPGIACGMPPDMFFPVGQDAWMPLEGTEHFINQLEWQPCDGLGVPADEMIVGPDGLLLFPAQAGCPPFGGPLPPVDFQLPFEESEEDLSGGTRDEEAICTNLLEYLTEGVEKLRKRPTAALPQELLDLMEQDKDGCDSTIDATATGSTGTPRTSDQAALSDTSGDDEQVRSPEAAPADRVEVERPRPGCSDGAAEQRRRNAATAAYGRTEIITTAMLRNIPNKYTREMLVDQLNKDFRGQFDFVYLPIDFKNKCNVGYGFVNFRTSEAHSRFVEKFDNVDVHKCLPGLNSKKVAEVKPARVQGRDENVSRLQGSALLMGQLSENPEWTPLLFGPDGAAQEFPLFAESLEENTSSRASRKQKNTTLWKSKSGMRHRERLHHE